MDRNFWRAFGLFAGGVIGVGIFGLPAALITAGLPAFLVQVVMVAVLVFLIHRWFITVILATPGRHRLPGYARLHLGRWGAWLATGANILGLHGALVAYLLAGGAFLRLLLEPVLPLPPSLSVLVYLVPGALLLLWGVRALPWLELGMLALFLLVLLVLPASARGHAVFARIPLSGEGMSVVVPYGVLLFSLWGLSLLPETVELVGRSRKRSLQVLAVGLGTAVVVSVAFAVFIASVTGEQTTEDALTGLKRVLGDGVVFLTLVFGLLTTFSSYLALGLTLLRTYRMDLRLSKGVAWALSVGVPLFLVFSAVRSLLAVLAFTGAILLGIEGLVVLLMRARLFRRRPSPALLKLLALVLVLLLAGMILESARALGALAGPPRVLS